MRVEFLRCPVDILTMSETIECARAAMRGRTRLQHVALNVAKLVNMRHDPVLASDVTSSDLVGVDGMGIVWAARWLGIPIKERVAGIDLFEKLLEVCAADGFRPFFLGATSDVVHRAAEHVLKKHSTVCFAGIRDGYFKPEQEREVVNEIRTSGADCLFIGMPTPRKERFLAAYRDELNVPFIMGVGGSFDILAGEVRRAPATMQALGLEWLYRVYQEPRRMWWRYAKTNTLFAAIMIQEIVRHRWATRPHPSRPAGTGSPDR
jgi:N-acetylglucosaminyldiphosphoundecaprenol N-acetyl-beta-D-mannosaminyltransferase